MTEIYSFGEWVKQRRKQLRLTQREIATQAHCSVATIKKIERDERRPSLDLAELLADVLRVAPQQRDIFIECARGQRPVDALATNQATSEVAKPAPQSFQRHTPLPLSSTPFIGRTAEIAHIADMLANPNCRLLVLVGPGGVGKSRLALAVAHAQQGNFSGGVIFVPLAAIDDTNDIAPTIAKVLNQPLTGPDPADSQLQRLLHTKEMLLVLDNFEQLVAGATLLGQLLANGPRLKLLITSRERLNLAEEWLYPVSGFSPEQAAHLFGQTAQRVQPHFDLAGQQAAITDICQLVDGLPLAVELAASWTRLMPCDQIAAHIRQDLDFLSGGPRNAPERHHSLRALFDHSWQLLSPPEQEALAGLSVFRGGFAPEEAAAVAGVTWPVLLGLVDKSLVIAQANGRYNLHELTRQYAAAKLQAANGEQFARQQHFDTYLMLAKRLNPQLHGPDGIAAYARLDQEQDNLRAALRWGVETGQINAVLHLVNQLFFFWIRRGYWREGEQWGMVAVSQAGNKAHVDLCIALAQLPTFIAIQGRYAEAAPYLPRALPMARRLEEAEPLVVVLTTLAQATPNPQEAFAAWDEALTIINNDETLKWQQAIIYNHYGDRLRNNGRYAEAAARYRQSLDLMRQMGNVDMIAYPLGNLGLLALHEGRLNEAHQLIVESVTISQASGNWVGVGDWFFRLGLVLLYLNRTGEAAVFLQEALTIYTDMDNRRGQASVLACLAQLALIQAEIALAASYIEQSLTTFRNLHRQMQQASTTVSQMMSFQITFTPDEIDSLLRAALVFSTQHYFERAAILFGVVESLLAQNGHKPAPPLQTQADETIETIRQQMSEEAFAAAREAGRTMRAEQILDFIGEV